MYLQGQNGLMNTFKESWRSRGPLAYLVAGGLISFYLILYFTPRLDGFARDLGLMNRWHFYGFAYCIFMLAGGAYYLWHHGNSRYNVLRISTNVIVQIVFGFTLPFVMEIFGQKGFYFSYLWPLKIDYLYPQTLVQLPVYLAIYAVLGSVVLFPLAAFFFGKRFYCSWICGCGGLANTFGDPWRHLTASSTPSWKFEQVAIHTVMLIAFSSTALIAIDFIYGENYPQLTYAASYVKGWYGIIVGSILAGVIGTGLYPILGPRVWCRNFCPMAAYLGLIQKLGRFRIRVKENMCISCGNCTTYCEMGIDVRSYAQNNESFTRASCVGCGMCAHVCPRGVLKLENMSPKNTEKKRQRLNVINF